MKKILKDVPQKDTLVVQGNWNTKIGMDACKQWKGCAGKFGVGTTNERQQVASVHKSIQIGCCKHSFQP